MLCYLMTGIEVLPSLHLKDFHHFIAKVVDDFHCDTAGLGLIESTGCVAVEGGPGFVIDLGF